MLGALASALPDLAPRLLERLLACTVVRPNATLLPSECINSTTGVGVGGLACSIYSI